MNESSWSLHLTVLIDCGKITPNFTEFFLTANLSVIYVGTEYFQGRRRLINLFYPLSRNESALNQLQLTLIQAKMIDSLSNFTFRTGCLIRRLIHGYSFERNGW